MLQEKEILNIFSLHYLNISNVKGIKSLGGGCSDFTFRIDTEQGSFFLKYYSTQSSEVEAKGLELLRSTDTVAIPKVLGFGSFSGYNYLLLQWIESVYRKPDYWKVFGEKLAALHRTKYPYYGLSFDNFIGRLPQVNFSKNCWVDFFVENRLQVQLKMSGNTFSSKDLQLFDQLFKKLPNLLPEEFPSLLHGDLWSGNVMVDDSGGPVLIDPAVYHGNREIEIAFTRLFGSFPEEFYDSYNSCLPLTKDFESRIDLYNLYPLLVHVNMFGGGYINQVKAILKRFTL